MSLHKRRRCRSIDDVTEVIGNHNGKIVTDKILVEAVSHYFARIHVGKGTSLEWIPKDYLFLHINIGYNKVRFISTYYSRNVRRYVGAHHSFSQMNLHRPLAIPAQYDLRIRTVARRLVQQIRSCLRSSRITANKITTNGGRIVYSLHGNILCSDQIAEMVEERRADDRANVAELDGTPCKNDGDRLASNAGDVGELVTLNIQVVLSFAEGCAGGACPLEALGMGHVDWDGADG